MRAEDARSSRRHPVPTGLRRMRRGPVAVLRDVCRGRSSRWSRRGAVAADDPSPIDVDRCRDCPPTPITSARSAFAYRGPARGRGPPSEVLRVARGGGGARGGPRGARPAAGRRRDVGAARAPAAGRARVRPGSRARAGARTRAGSPRGRLRPPDEGDRSTGSTDPGGAIGGDGRCVRVHPREARAGAPAAGRRRADDGRDRFGLRRSAPRGGGARDPSPHRLPVVHRPAARTSRLAPALRPCLYSGVLPSGSVVARGSTPVVDASRGRNDPRKATLGRRAWSGLEVSPAPDLRKRLRERARVGGPCRNARAAGGRPRRRVWGQRPGQPGGSTLLRSDARGSQMDLTFTGRGVPVSDDIREQAEHKLARLGRLEPRTTRHGPRGRRRSTIRAPDGLKMVKAALKIPRKTFRARAEADDVRTALDHVAREAGAPDPRSPREAARRMAQGSTIPARCGPASCRDRRVR